MGNIGWIKLYRQITECEVLWDSSEEPFDRRSAWIDLLLMANHKDKRTLFRGKAITVKCGQRITSLHKLAERWHWGINRVRIYLDLLQGEGMLIRESDNTKTLITIVNYQKYQGFDEFEQTPTDTVTDTVTNTPTDTVTNIAQIQSQIPNNNNKNDKENKKIYGAFRHVRLTDSEKEKLEADFGSSTVEDCIKKLDEYIEETGKKYKNHNLTIRRWVVDAVKKDKGVTKPKPNTFTNIQKTDYDFAELEKQLLSKPI